MQINPDITPPNISMDEIRQITLRHSHEVRFFHVHSNNYEIQIVALKTVYFSDDFGDSRYFVEKLRDFVGGRLLEIGCGTGVVSIAFALENKYDSNSQKEPHVAVDINPEAVKNTKINLLINNLENQIVVRQGDVFSALNDNEKFDCIFWNHPFHKGNADEDMIMRACFDPLFEGFEEYVRYGHAYLENGGKLLLGSGNFADLDHMRIILAKHGCYLDLLDFIHRPFKATSGKLKTFNIYEIKRDRQKFSP